MINLDQAKENIGKVIKIALDSKNISQTELAKKVGCDKTAISHYVSGERVPKMDVLISICSVLEIDLNSFFNGDFSKANNIENIPTNENDILYAIAVLIKAKVLNYDEQSGQWWFSSQYNSIHQFAEDILRFINSKYSKLDEVLLDLIKTYTRALIEEKFASSTDGDLPF